MLAMIALLAFLGQPSRGWRVRIDAEIEEHLCASNAREKPNGQKITERGYPLFQNDPGEKRWI